MSPIQLPSVPLKTGGDGASSFKHCRGTDGVRGDSCKRLANAFLFATLAEVCERKYRTAQQTTKN